MTDVGLRLSWLATEATNGSCTGHIRSGRYVGGAAHRNTAEILSQLLAAWSEGSACERAEPGLSAFIPSGGNATVPALRSTPLLYKETVYVLSVSFSHSFLACFTGWEAGLLLSSDLNSFPPAFHVLFRTLFKR